MAQQFVTNPVAPSAQDNLDLLYTNLAENVAYRRAKQQMKAAQKQDLELKMAQGLIPKANITVTDEGFAFEGEDTLGSELLGTERKDTSAAREAFWRAVGKPEPNEDMTREGFTNVLEEQVPGQQEAFAAMVEQARRAADETLSPEERNLAQQNYANASAMLGSVANRPPLTEQPDTVIPTIPIPQPQPQPQVPERNPFWKDSPEGASRALSMPSGNNIGAAVGGSGATTATPPPPPPQPASLGAMMAGRLAKQGPIPAKPATPATPEDKATSATEKIQQGGSISEMGQVEVNMKRGGFDVQMANVATKTTQVQSAQIDEIKRSIPRLAGLAALENYGNQLMQTRGYNTGAPMQDTFSTLLNQRVKDIARWEEAATKSGTSRTLEKLDPYKMEVKPTEYGIKATRKDQLKATTNITTNVRGGDTTSPAQVQQANLPAATAGETTLISYNEQGRKLTGAVSGLAMRSTGALNFTDGNGLVNVLTVQKNRANTMKQGKYDVKILQKDSKTGQPQMIQVQTPSGPITLEYEDALQNSTYKDKDGQTIKTHGWKVSAPTGMEIKELERFTGHILTK